MRMTELQLKKAQELCNARMKEKFAGQGMENQFKEMGQGDIGRMIRPDLQESQIDIAMSKLFNGKMKRIPIDLIPNAANSLGVDPNFLYGFPSIHDEDYKRLIEKNEG